MMDKQEASKKRLLRNDLLLIAALAAVAVIGLLVLLLRGNGDTVRVTVNGELYAAYPLSENRVEEIVAADAQYNRLVIEDGKVFVESASCPDGICAAHRPIFRDGESIVCLPHGVVITMVRADTHDAPDLVV